MLHVYAGIKAISLNKFVEMVGDVKNTYFSVGQAKDVETFVPENAHSLRDVSILIN